MAFANYNDFRVGVEILANGDDLTGTFSHNTLDMIITLGEARVHNGDRVSGGLRASSMLSPLAQVVTNNVAPLPDDLLQLRDPRFSGEHPLEIVPLVLIERNLSDGPNGGTARLAAQDGDSLRFWPTASGTLIGSYYARPPALADGLHATFLRYPEVYLYAALYEAALFLGEGSKMQIWEARYRQLIDGASHAERTRVYGGGQLRQRVR